MNSSEPLQALRGHAGPQLPVKPGARGSPGFGSRAGFIINSGLNADDFLGPFNVPPMNVLWPKVLEFRVASRVAGWSQLLEET